MPLKWNLPGGGIDPGETSLQTAVRETQEETGYTPEELELLGDFEYMPGRLIAMWLAKKVIGTSEWPSCAMLLAMPLRPAHSFTA
jgi:predicted NUDIX family NTP pyrophosphohydrolase